MRRRTHFNAESTTTTSLYEPINLNYNSMCNICIMYREPRNAPVIYTSIYYYDPFHRIFHWCEMQTHTHKHIYTYNLFMVNYSSRGVRTHSTHYKILTFSRRRDVHILIGLFICTQHTLLLVNINFHLLYMLNCAQRTRNN